jgi:hypothetical protein
MERIWSEGEKQIERGSPTPPACTSRCEASSARGCRPVPALKLDAIPGRLEKAKADLY